MIRTDDGDLVSTCFVNSGSVSGWMEALDKIQATIAEMNPEQAGAWAMDGLKETLGKLMAHDSQPDHLH